MPRNKKTGSCYVLGTFANALCQLCYWRYRSKFMCIVISDDDANNTKPVPTSIILHNPFYPHIEKNRLDHNFRHE